MRCGSVPSNTARRTRFQELRQRQTVRPQRRTGERHGGKPIYRSACATGRISHGDAHSVRLERLTVARTIESVAVLGCGTMGSGIAAVSAAAGCRVLLLDVSVEAASRGLHAVAEVDRHLVSVGTFDQTLPWLLITTGFAKRLSKTCRSSNSSFPASSLCAVTGRLSVPTHQVFLCETSPLACPTASRAM